MSARDNTTPKAGTLWKGFVQYVLDKHWPLPGKPKDHGGFNLVDLPLRALLGTELHPFQDRLKLLCYGRTQKTFRDWQVQFRRSSVLYATNSHLPLLRLPNELLNMVDSNLELADKIAWRLSCGELFMKLPMPDPSVCYTSVGFRVFEILGRNVEANIQKLELAGNLIIQIKGKKQHLSFCQHCRTARLIDHFPGESFCGPEIYRTCLIKRPLIIRPLKSEERAITKREREIERVKVREKVREIKRNRERERESERRRYEEKVRKRDIERKRERMGLDLR